jgi:hypothetical protein
MQQRRLRLGDILDDYCPRERRITNHAVVAMIDDQVKQTRCTTCDADHEYKQARVPSPRRRKDAGALSEPMGEAPRAVKADEAPADDPLLDDTFEADLPDLDNEPLVDAVAVAEAAASDDDPPDVLDDEGPVHRPLIRATLPRPEGHAPDWKEPEFTVRQPGRGGRENDGNRNGHGGHGGSHGQRPGRNRRPIRAGSGGAQGNNAGPSRFGGPRQGNPRHGSGQGQHSNRPGGPPGGQRRAGRPGDHRGPGRKRGR